MTRFSETARSGPEFVGPFSPWPRRRLRPSRRHFAAGAGAAAAALFTHCILPLL